MRWSKTEVIRNSSALILPFYLNKSKWVYQHETKSLRFNHVIAIFGHVTVISVDCWNALYRLSQLPADRLDGLLKTNYKTGKTLLYGLREDSLWWRHQDSQRHVTSLRQSRDTPHVNYCSLNPTLLSCTESWVSYWYSSMLKLLSTTVDNSQGR